MRKAITVIGLILIGLRGSARAQDSVPAAPPPPTSPPLVVPVAPPLVAEAPDFSVDAYRQRRIEVNLAFLPMAFGKYTTPVGAMEVTSNASFAYGASVAASYRIIAGLSLGVAPQVVFNVNDKTNPSGATVKTGREYDLMVRVAYTQPLVETIAIYAEALPGYSIIAQPGSPAAKGIVLAGGAGVIMGLSDRSFLNVGAGYQVGYQAVTLSGMKLDDHTHYLRAVLGGGFRF